MIKWGMLVSMVLGKGALAVVMVTLTIFSLTLGIFSEIFSEISWGEVGVVGEVGNPVPEQVVTLKLV